LIETNRYRISGVVRLPRDGYRSRLTDYLNASERAFLALTDVDIEPLDRAGPSERRPFLALSLSHVVLAMPADGEAASRAGETSSPPEASANAAGEPPAGEHAPP
jgi:hypothetical protein